MTRLRSTWRFVCVLLALALTAERASAKIPYYFALVFGSQTSPKAPPLYAYLGDLRQGGR